MEKRKMLQYELLVFFMYFRVIIAKVVVLPVLKYDSGLPCSRDGYFRNPYDCGKFYRCVDFEGNGKQFTVFSFNCSDGLVFDEEKTTCNRANDTAPCDQLPASSSDVSELICTHEGFFRHPKNCGKFYGCMDLTGTGMTFEVLQYDCYPGLVFDETTCSCTIPKLAEPCENSDSGRSSSNKPTDGSELSLSNGQDSSSESTRICNEIGFFRDPDDCQKFYRCVNQSEIGLKFKVYEFICPTNLVFDENISSCNWPNKVSSCEGSFAISQGFPKQESSTSTNREQLQGSEQQTISDGSSTGQISKSNCTKVDDKDSSLSTQEPETSKKDSNPPTDSTDSSTSKASGSDDSFPSSSESNQLTCSTAGFFRYPGNCQKFYRCVNVSDEEVIFTIYVFTCPKTLVFDERYNVCNFASIAPPCHSQMSPPEDRSQIGSSTPVSESSLLESSSSESGPPSGNVTPESELSSEDAVSSVKEGTEGKGTSLTPENSGEESSSGSETDSDICPHEGYFRNPRDCHKFYRCVDYYGNGNKFTLYQFICPERLVFDENINVCNSPNKAPPCDEKSACPSDIK
ncbi:uncharacterized protein LOC143234349 [Tachypleus tridentatus]|uniref:uncharacterized protein LOC143234349 n=1 Tax=Tachypleus tridentatus TaxID=6853 RepID=UPI003FD67A94